MESVYIENNEKGVDGTLAKHKLKRAYNKSNLYS